MQINSGSLIVNYVALAEKNVFFAEISWQEGIITAIQTLGSENPDYPYLIPGFIDAHVHIESSMLPPSEFARIAVRHGTIATVSDPHEIANVLGIEGVLFMLENAAQTPFNFFFGAPSCVPATTFETAGAVLDLEQIETLFEQTPIKYLSEMMNYPGVLGQDATVMAKLALAKRYNYPIDGHAPGLTGEDALRYAQAGISTDHECLSLAEAETKLAAGMKILIREGSAARNFADLHSLISTHSPLVMLCSDDKHPDDLVAGHINQLAATAVAAGHDIFSVLQCACINPIRHYDLPLGQLRLGDCMDAVLVESLRTLQPLKTWLKGELVAEHGLSLLPSVKAPALNQFNARKVAAADFTMPARGENIRVIKAFDGELLTEEWQTRANIEQDNLVIDTGRDILLLTVINRYQPQLPAVAFINGFGLHTGALASTIAHDSHNIIAVAADIDSLCLAVNRIIDEQGGIAVAQDGQCSLLPLPIAGLMSDADGDEVASRYAQLDRQAKQLGSKLRAPFMTLSFMALLVIPELKLSDQGLFDGRSFKFTPVTV
ncbi:MAG: adenine deaminase [Methylobacter sp.]|jgi:adenine deaminase|nr:adenine deaminase [Methylobacter sp.]